MPRLLSRWRMQIFKYHIDRRTIVYTVLTFVVFIAVAVALLLLYTGGFFSAWFISLVLAMIALMVLSVPRKIVVTDEALEIRCVSDITVIELREIASVQLLTKNQMRGVMPIFGAVGFFGYYGKFFDFKELETITIYSSEWNNFVEITDIYDYRTIVSCRDGEALKRLIDASIGVGAALEVEAATEAATEVENATESKTEDM